jgi:hypothetical protein
MIRGRATCRTISRPPTSISNPLQLRGDYRRITLSRQEWPDFVFAFHDGEEIGPRMLSRIARRTGLRPEDL